MKKQRKTEKTEHRFIAQIHSVMAMKASEPEDETPPQREINLAAQMMLALDPLVFQVVPEVIKATTS